MRKITLLALLCLTFFAQAGEKNLATAKTLEADESLLVQCFSYFTPGSINLPMGQLTVAGLMPGDPNLTVTYTQLLGMPITGTLHGTGKRNSDGVSGKVSGYLSQLGHPKIWVESELVAIYPRGSENGTLTMTKIGSGDMELKNGCQS